MKGRLGRDLNQGNMLEKSNVIERKKMSLPSAPFFLKAGKKLYERINSLEKEDEKIEYLYCGP